MAPTLAYSAAAQTDGGMSMLGGAEGYDGMYQVLIRLPNTQTSFVTNSLLPTDPSIVTKVHNYTLYVDDSRQYTTFVFSRKITPSSQPVHVYAQEYNNQPRHERFIQLIFTEAVEIVEQLESFTYIDRNFGSDAVAYGKVHPIDGDFVLGAIGHMSSNYSNEVSLRGLTAIDTNEAKFKAGYFVSSGETYGLPDNTRYPANQIPTTGSVFVFRQAESGIAFQIKHNGQLIPATPHLWTGGQLEPITLNLPQ